MLKDLKPQLVLHLHKEEGKKKPKISGDYIISEKLDGIYAYIDYENGSYGHIHSRAGRIIPAFELYRERFNDLSRNGYGARHRLIMEACIPGLTFHTMNGIFNRSIGDYHCKEVEFHVHDIVTPLNSKGALDRYKTLKDLVLVEETPNIKVHPILGISDNKDIWLKYFNHVKETGGEGVVLKHVDGVYHPDKRNSSLMKIKLEESFKLLCVDMFYTIGDKGHSNLNITLRRKSGAEIVVRIGKHSDIDKIEEDKNYILGQACLVECMTEITPGGMLREPRFKQVLPDFNLNNLD